MKSFALYIINVLAYFAYSYRKDNFMAEAK